MGTYGQDWASYQSATPPTAGLGFAFVKATEGTGYINPLHAAQVAHARANGLVVGHYHYPHMAADPVVEAGYFLSAANPQPGDILVLDWEGYDPANKGVSTSRQIAYKNAFLARVLAAAPAHQVGTYANADYLGRDPKGVYGDFLWIATANQPAGQPGIDHMWLFHQYGASGVDRDYCPLTTAQLKTWAHAKEVDVPLTSAEIDAIALRVWSYSNPKSGDTHDMHQSLRNAENSSATAAKSNPVVLTDAQVTAFAQQLATNPAFVTAVAAATATATVDLEAKRLQS